MSNSTLYYSERQLMRHAEQPKVTIFSFLSRLVGHDRKEWTSDIVTRDNIDAVLSLSAVFLSVHPELAPFYSFDLRVVEAWQEHDDLGRMFIPRNIMLSDAQDHYFIVEIDGEFEIRFWPGYSLPCSDSHKKEHFPVTDEGILRNMEKSFSVFLIKNGVLSPPDDDPRYFQPDGSWVILPENGGVPGTPPKLPRYVNSTGDRSPMTPTVFTAADLRYFIGLLGMTLTEDDFDDVLMAANDPDGFFDANLERLAQRWIDEPYDLMFLDLLMASLKEANVVEILDWKEGVAEVAASIAELTDGAFPSVVTEEDGEIACDVLGVAEERLKENGVALLDLNTQSDSFAILIVPLGQADELINAAKACALNVRWASQA